ncbi:uncharacterized protein LOC135138530 [Zophobas morio]|uniref:uncharacterized protein LOC135138530 n=1 Tax=Zophobas morio TaxID=2755281 RepID=UPI003083AE48
MYNENRSRNEENDKKSNQRSETNGFSDQPRENEVYEDGNKTNPSKTTELTTEEGTTYEFEEVNRFKYLGVVITNKNEMNEEIEERIAKANKSVGRLNRFLRSKNVTRRTKKQVYKTIVRPTVLYASETWTLTNEKEQKLEVWERKILRKIYGGIKELDQWRRRTNREIE